MNPQSSISGVGLDLSDVGMEMEFWARHPIILSKNWSLELLRDDHSLHQSQFFEIQPKYPLDFYSTQTIFQLLVSILSGRILLIIVVSIIIRNCRTGILLFFLILPFLG